MHKYTQIGLISFIILALMHFYARDITWPNPAIWGTEIEATEFYTNQKSLEKICEILMLLSVGISLIGFWETRSQVSASKPIDAPDVLTQEEQARFSEWVTEDLSRVRVTKFANSGSQIDFG